MLFFCSQKTSLGHVSCGRKQEELLLNLEDHNSKHQDQSLSWSCTSYKMILFPLQIWNSMKPLVRERWLHPDCIFIKLWFRTDYARVIRGHGNLMKHWDLSLNNGEKKTSGNIRKAFSCVHLASNIVSAEYMLNMQWKLIQWLIGSEIITL